MSAREKIATFMLRNGIATGHGDTTDDLLTELQGHIDDLRANLHTTVGQLEEAKRAGKERAE